LLGNKCDQAENRILSTDSAKAYAKQRKMEFYETSAKNNVKVNDAFYYIAKKLMLKRDYQI
jgi:Ras-related protein Rab-5C